MHNASHPSVKKKHQRVMPHHQTTSSPISRISEDSFVHILQFIRDDYCSFARFLSTCKELQKVATENDRILMQVEMRKKYDARAPLFAAVHMGTYLEKPPMVYNGTCRHSSYLNDITVWKDVKKMFGTCLEHVRKVSSPASDC